MNSGCTHRIIINLRGVYCKTRRNSMHIFTSRKYRFLGNVFFHAVIYGKTHVQTQEGFPLILMNIFITCQNLLKREAGQW